MIYFKNLTPLFYQSPIQTFPTIYSITIVKDALDLSHNNLKEVQL